jgi:hypothetical protein
VRALKPRVSWPWGYAAVAALSILLVSGSFAPTSWRALDVLVLLAAAGAAGWAGVRIAAVLVPEAGLCGRIVAAFTVAIGILTGSATVLGHFGHLHSRPFLLLVEVLLLASLCLAPAPGFWCAPPAEVRLRSAAGAVRALLVAAAVALALRFGGSVVHVVRDPGAFLLYDDLSYHLPAAAVWQQAGDLRTLKFETGDPSPTFYPFVGELCSWVALAPLGDSDVLARRMQLPFALCSLVAVAALARRVGLSRGSALFAAVLYATVDRAFPALALGAGNDHAAAFFSLAGLDGALVLARRPCRRLAAYTGIALGLLIGTKYIGLFFAATIAAALLALVGFGPTETNLPSPLPGAGTRAPMHQIYITVGALALLCGGYAYARNAWTTGNPVFPAPVTAFGYRIWNGWNVATLAWRRQLPEFRIDTLHFLTRRPDLFGQLFPFTMLPAAVVAPALAIARRRPALAVLSVLPITFFLEFRFLMHDHRDLRYVLPGVALAAIAAAWVVEAAGPRYGPALASAGLAGALLAASERLHVGSLLQAALLVLLVAIGGLVSQAAGRYGNESSRPAGDRQALHPALMALGVLILIGLAAWGGSRCIEQFQATKLARQPAASALERAVGAAGARVAYVGSNAPYLFFGSRLQNHVEVVPTDGDLGAEYYFWGGSAHFPFDAGSASQWRANLMARRIAFVVAARTSGEGPERTWMAASPREFIPVYHEAQVEIWRFVPSAAAARR